MSVRSAAAATLLAVLTLVPCLNVCSGWMHSARQRMACCTHAGGMQRQATADACCAHGERKNGEQMAPLSIAPPTLQPSIFSAESLTIPVHFASSLRFEIHEPIADSERYVLLSVFLI
jgi:hypothetical protein